MVAVHNVSVNQWYGLKFELKIQNWPMHWCHSNFGKRQNIPIQSNRQTFSSHVLERDDNRIECSSRFPTRHSNKFYLFDEKSLEFIQIENFPHQSVRLAEFAIAKIISNRIDYLKSAVIRCLTSKIIRINVKIVWFKFSSCGNL